MKVASRFLALALTIALVACSKDVAIPDQQGSADIKVQVNARETETRTYFSQKDGDSYPTLWSTNKSVRFSLNGDAYVDATPSLQNGGKEASFSLSFASTSATSGTIYAFSPKGNYAGSTSTSNIGGFTSSSPYSKYGSVYFIMPASQTPLANSPDEAAQALWAKATYSGGLPSSVDMHFDHISAYAKMTLDNYPGGEIQSVSIAFPTAVAGNSISFFYKDGTYYSTPYEEGTYANANVSTITLDAQNVANNVFWFGLMPVGELTSGSIVVTVLDKQGNSYAKTIDLSSTKKIAFKAGRVSAFSVNMEGSGSSGGSGGGESGGGTDPTTPSSLAYGSCYEVPAVSVPSSSLPYSKSGSLTTDNNNDHWLNAKTNTSTQLYVVHRTKSGSAYTRNLIMLHDANKKVALWVAYALNSTTWKDANVSRNDNWVYDPAIPESAQPNLASSYSGSYDRGHQAASNDRQHSVAANMQTFYFSNMTPQYSTLNQGNWATLEGKVQNFGWSCKTTDTLYVVTGPVFGSSYSTTTDKSGVACPIPSRYYKCLMKCSFNSSGTMTAAKGVAYLTPGNDASSDTAYTGWITTIDAVEELTGFDFFANVPESLQTAAEKTKVALF